MLAALRSRVHVLAFDPPDAQVGALLLALADRGWPTDAVPPTVTPDEAGEVARYTIRERLRVGARFDLRVFTDTALPAYQQWKGGETESDWRELVSVASSSTGSRRPNRA